MINLETTVWACKACGRTGVKEQCSCGGTRAQLACKDALQRYMNAYEPSSGWYNDDELRRVWAEDNDTPNTDRNPAYDSPMGVFTGMEDNMSKITGKLPNPNRLMEMIESDENAGFCLACGEEADSIEPDAREYECESCGESKVYGAEELLLMGFGG